MQGGCAEVAAITGKSTAILVLCDFSIYQIIGIQTIINLFAVVTLAFIHTSF